MWPIVSSQQYINTILKILLVMLTLNLLELWILVILNSRGDDLAFKYWTGSKKKTNNNTKRSK